MNEGTFMSLFLKVVTWLLLGDSDCCCWTFLTWSVPTGLLHTASTARHGTVEKAKRSTFFNAREDLETINSLACCSLMEKMHEKDKKMQKTCILEASVFTACFLALQLTHNRHYNHAVLGLQYKSGIFMLCWFDVS